MQRSSKESLGSVLTHPHSAWIICSLAYDKLCSAPKRITMVTAAVKIKSFFFLKGHILISDMHIYIVFLEQQSSLTQLTILKLRKSIFSLLFTTSSKNVQLYLAAKTDALLYL